MKPVLFVFSGLPGTGKTTLSKEIAPKYQAAYLRIDTIEHGIKELCNFNVQGEGYRLSYRITRDNLFIGNNVVIDCCNPFKFTRIEWNNVAIDAGANYLDIEIQCSDKDEHKRRSEERISDIDRFKLPTWEEIETREYEKWDKEIITIDTAKKSIEESIQELNSKINISIGNFA